MGIYTFFFQKKNPLIWVRFARPLLFADPFCPWSILFQVTKVTVRAARSTGWRETGDWCSDWCSCRWVWEFHLRRWQLTTGGLETGLSLEHWMLRFPDTVWPNDQSQTRWRKVISGRPLAVCYLALGWVSHIAGYLGGLKFPQGWPYEWIWQPKVIIAFLQVFLVKPVCVFNLCWHV